MVTLVEGASVGPMANLATLSVEIVINIFNKLVIDGKFSILFS